jgi:alpha-glucosidase
MAAREVEALIARYEGSLPSGGWPNWVLGNHDNPRVASRLGEAQARVAAMLLLTLRGTPTIYYGEEIGMRDVEVSPELVHDPEARIGIPYRPQGRDPYRTPMQWEPGAGAGFTRGSPWLPASPDTGAVNVATERDAPDSMLSLYRSLLALRRREAALSVGAYAPVAAQGDVLAYLREAAGDRFLIALNFADRPGTLSLGPELGGGRLELSTLGITEGEAQVADTLRVRPNEGVVVRLASPPAAR